MFTRVSAQKPLNYLLEMPAAQKSTPFWLFNKKVGFISLICAILFIFSIYSYSPRQFGTNFAIENPADAECKNWESTRNSDFCGEELMRYSIRIRGHAQRSENFVTGRRFNCSLLSALNRHKLSDKFAINEQIPVKRPGEPGFAIVTASTANYFPYLKTFLFNVKRQFECRQQIIVYDLDGFSDEPKMMESLSAVCGLQIRKFQWALLPAEVTERLNIFAWKIAISAEIFAEFDTWIWADTAIVFHDPRGFEPIFGAIERRQISEFILPQENRHGMRYATNPRMYNFLPFAPDWFQLAPEWENNQWEASIFLGHKSEYTRKLLKWALLCAFTRDCIEPTGSKMDCESSDKTQDGYCNRQDQSVLAILTVNGEYEKMHNQGIQFLPHPDPKHPRRGLSGPKYEVRKREKLNEADERDFVKIVNCCQKEVKIGGMTKKP